MTEKVRCHSSESWNPASVCHCEERSDEAISDYDYGCSTLSEIATLISSACGGFILLALGLQVQVNGFTSVCLYL